MRSNSTTRIGLPMFSTAIIETYEVYRSGGINVKKILLAIRSSKKNVDHTEFNCVQLC